MKRASILVTAKNETGENLMTSKMYMSCADTAKLVRKALKEAFPAIKFSVRSDTYSGGASIRVGWVDGPSTEQVEDVAGVFRGAYFDGMIDYQGTITSAINGEPVRFAADFIFFNRTYSDAALALACSAVATKYAGNIKALAGTLSPVDDWPAMWREGRLCGVEIIPGAYGDMALSGLIRKAMTDFTGITKLRSPTAESVTVLYDDGYGNSPYGGKNGERGQG